MKNAGRVSLQPGTPTLQNANPDAYPGLPGAGKQINQFLNDEAQDIANQLFYGGLSVIGANASASWLECQEAQGGHTLAKHVGLSDQQLLDRLATTPGISGASTFLSEGHAEVVIGRTIEANRPLVDQWLATAKVNQTLALPFMSQIAIGRGVLQGETVASWRTNAVVVLKALGGGKYYVLTAYPR